MIELRTLGGLDLRGVERSVADAALAQPKRAALLVFLAVVGAGGRLMRRDRLFGLLWPDQTEGRARAALRQMLYSLRNDLGADLLATRGDDEVGMDPDALACDVAQFDEAIAAAAFPRAVELFHGPFLAGFHVKGSVEFDQWMDSERERLGRAYGRALDSLAEEAAERGDIAEAVEWLRRLAAHNPYNTRTALKYMEALAEAGDRAGALQYADRLATRVEEDLGAAPSPDVQALAHRLRSEPTPRQDTRFIRVRPAEESRHAGIPTAVGERYTIVRELGAGGMATVYLAEDVKHRRQVALKVLKPELAAVLGPERFLREIRVTAGLNHPHILPLLDSGEADGRLYYAMPFMEGESLRDALNREKQLPVDRAVDVTTQVADALDYAHRHDVIHRDIKPENILLHDGKALVADFGIAMAVQSAGDTRLTETGLSVGTPQYMSPEQAAGERELDGRSDIYSLGCVLYEMLAGEPPYTGPTAQAILAKIATDEPRRVAQLRETVPGRVEGAVHRALQKLPADRFQRAGKLIDALSQTGSVLRDSPVPVGSERSRSRKAVIALSALTVILAWTALAGWLRQPTAPMSPMWLNLDEPAVSFDLSPDGSQVVLQRIGAPLEVRDLASRDVETLALNAPNPFFSPDGSQVAALNNAGLFSMPSRGGPATTVTTAITQNTFLYSGAWGRDGYIYFTNGHADGISRVSANGGAPEVVTVIDSAGGEHSARTPHAVDGGVLFTSWWGDSSRIMSYDPASGQTRRLFSGSTPRYAAGFLLFGDMLGTIHAVAFDPARLEATGSQTSVLERVEVDPYGWVEYAIADDGTLVYRPAWEAERELVRLDRQGRETRFLLQSGPYRGGFELSPDGSKVSFSRYTQGAAEIWVHSVDGREWRVTEKGRNYFPVWSPDGTRLVFASDRDGRGFSMYTKRADGGGAAELLLARPAGAYPVSWSPQDAILFWDNNGGVWAVRADGSGEEWTPVPGCDSGCGGYSRLSPDGRLIAHVDRGDLYVADLANPRATRLQVSSDGGGNPRWSPDGGEIYYYRERKLIAVSLDVRDDLRVTERRELIDLDGRNFDLGARLGLGVDPVSGDFVFIREGEQPPSLVVVLNFADVLRERWRNR